MDYSSVVKYLYENNQKFAAQAVQNATGQVLSAKAGKKKNHSYSPSVNRYLCEALFFVNSDPNAETKAKNIIRNLLETYRQINNMPTDDIPEPISVENNDIAKFIIENTELEEEYNVSDIKEAAEHYNDYITEADADDAIQELISLGYFKITASYYWTPTALKRIK